MVRDLTQGNTLKRILSFCLPLMTGQIFQQLYNMVDSVIVGRFAGTAELSAVGSTGALSFMVIGFVLGLCTGFSIPISHAFGEKVFSKLRAFYINSIYLTVFLSAVLTLITVILTGRILKAMNTPDDIYNLAYDYISIVFYGLTATFFYNLFACVMRSLGDSRTPLILLIISSALNIILDLLFVISFKMAVRGVAIATVMAQSFSAVLAFIIIRKKFDILRLEKGEARPDIRKCGHLLFNGLPMALQVSVTATGSIMLQSAVNRLGSTVIAAVTVASKIQLMLVLPSESIGITMATFCGQNVGACRIDRIKDGMVKAVMVGLVYSLFAMSIAGFFGNELAALFVSKSQTQVINYVVRFLNTCIWFYPILSVLFTLRNAIQGMGYSFPAMFAGVFELAARGIMGFIFIPVYGYSAVCIAHPMAWSAAVVFLVPTFFATYYFTKKKIIGEIKI